MQLLKEIEYKLATTRDELEQAYRLVYLRYADKGYIPPDWRGDIWVTPYCALPSTYVFVAKMKDRVVGTVSVFQDSDIGLPADVVLKEEIDKMRGGDRILCEIGMLACDKTVGSDESPLRHMGAFMLVLYLFKLIFVLGQEEMSDALCYVTVNPAHVQFYRVIGFKVVSGEAVDYQILKNAPAIALQADYNSVKAIMENKKFLKKIFLNTNKKIDFSKRYIWTLNDLKYFFIEKTNLWERLSPKTKDCILKTLDSNSS